MSVVDDLLARCAECTTEEPTPALRRATSAFLAELGAQPAPREVLQALSQLPPRGAAWLAITLGSAVEGGAPAEPSAGALVDLLRAWLAELPSPDVDHSDREHHVVLSMPYLCQSVVAHLARLPAMRETLAADRALRDALIDAESVTYAASWVRELLIRSSGQLFAVHAESGRVLELRYENVGSALHLFTLLQGAIGARLPGGRAPHRALVDAARGGPPTTQSDEAWWHYQDHVAPERSIGRSIWAELTVRDVPKLDGALVLVLWPKMLGARMWDANFFGPSLEAAPPNVSLLRELPAAEAAAWRARLGLPAR